MDILFVTDLYPISNFEVKTPKTLSYFVNCWQEQGHKVNVLKPNFLFNSLLRKKTFYKTGQYGDVYNVNYFTPFLFNVKNKIPEFHYDIIVAHMPSGIIFSNHLDGNLVCGVHYSDLEVLTNPIYSFYFKPQMEKAYIRAIGIACRSRILREKFLKLYPQFESKTFLCESGIDFEPVRSIKNLRKNVVTCANLIKRKNIDKLILALNDMPNLNLTVIGNGKELNKLQKIAKKNITFCGYQNTDKVREIMQNSDIFILPSINETFGMVYLEAMASGCITVCTKNDGIDGIIQDEKNGFLVEPNVFSIKSVLNKILQLSEDDVQFILQNCYNTVKSYNSMYCADKYIQNILKLYKGN